MNRNKEIDVLKGICILAIVFAHFQSTVLPDFIRAFNSSYMITGFYLVTGFLFSKKDTKPDIKSHIHKRWTTLALPYFYLSALLFIFDLSLYFLNFRDLDFILADIAKTLTLRGVGTLWFLPALFFGEIIFIQLTKMRVAARLFFLAIGIIYFSIYHFWGANYAYQNTLFRVIDLPFRSINNIFQATFVITMSYYFFKHFNGFYIFLTKKMNFIYLLFIIIPYFYFYGVASNYFASLYVATVGLFITFVSPLIIFLFSRILSKTPISNFFSYWGQNSFVLMAFHYSVYLPLFSILDERITGNINFSFEGQIIYSLLCLLLTVPLINFFNRSCGFIVGKPIRREAYNVQ